jgi:protein-S-isoprenylcysteine O-methyltransferase Ste14
MIIYTILSILWIVFVAYWFISAFSAKKTLKRSHGSLIVRILVLIVLIILWNTHILHGLQDYFTTSLKIQIIGLVAVCFGIALAVWARIYLGTNWGMPVSLKENPELVTKGPYSYIRHPIYSGILLAMFGATLITGLSWFVAFVIFGCYFIYSAVQEEKIMLKAFPNQYPEYKKKTKMFIPFIL